MIWMNKLPESCDDCPCLYDGIACQAAEFDNFVEESCTIFSSITDRHPNCPLKELVLCKDCCHYDKESKYCIFNDREMKLLDFCSYGEKKND